MQSKRRIQWLIWLALVIASLLLSYHHPIQAAPPFRDGDAPAAARVLGTHWKLDGSQILTWADDRAARVWDATTGELLFTLQHDLLDPEQPNDAQVGPVLSATWNRDETQILTWADDGTARVWDATIGALQFTLQHGPTYSAQTHEEQVAPVLGATWNHDETQLLTWALDSTARVWDATTGQELLTLSHEPYFEFKRATWSPDETRILTHGADKISIWDATTSDELLILPTASQVTWSHDGSRLLTGDVTAQVWDATTGRILVTVHHDVYLHPYGKGVIFRGVGNATWNHDDTRFMTSSTDGTIRVWDAATGDELLVLYHEYAPADTITSDWMYLRDPQWNVNETRILASDYEQLYLWDATTGERLLILPQPGWDWRLRNSQWSRDGTRALIWGGSTVNIVDTVQGEIEQDLYHANAYPPPSGHNFEGNPGSINGAAWNQAETQVLVWREEGLVQAWDMTSEERLYTLFCVCSQAAWSPDETRILTWGGTGWASTGSQLVSVWDATTGELLLTLYHGAGKNPFIDDQAPPVAAPLPDEIQQSTTVQAALDRAANFTGGNVDWEPFIWYFDDVPMALVPVGCFELGDIQRVCFDEPFWIDVNEVSNAQFAAFDGHATRTQDERHQAPDDTRVNITWYEAREFCQQRGARLPTEAEWEYVARGPDGWEYARGNAGDTYGQIPWVSASEMVAGGINGDFQGEWVADWYHFDYFRSLPEGVVNPTGPDLGSAKSIRGLFNQKYPGIGQPMRAIWRDPASPSSASPLIGFRCARS